MTEQQDYEIKMSELNYKRRVEFEELKHRHVMEELQFMAKNKIHILNRGFKSSRAEN